MNPENQIYSSTGNLGVSRRQYGRLYVNATHFSDDPSVFVSRAEGWLHERGRPGRENRIGRAVFRGLVSQGVLDNLTHNGLHQYLEVAFQPEEFTHDRSWLIYLARNHSSRTQIVPTDEMIRETQHYRRTTAPVDRVKSIRDQGYTFTDQILESDVDQVHRLWSETFGWERHEVEALRKHLNNIHSTGKNERSLWFSGIRHNGKIVSLAMAERLPIPGAKKDLNLLESTEWKTSDEYAGQGLLTGVLAFLNAQIMHDMGSHGNGLPLIYAECNFQSRSDRAGHGAGFTIPDRRIAPQILVQNVLVSDGQAIPEGKLRDFTFMYVPGDLIRKYYDQMSVQAILNEP